MTKEEKKEFSSALDSSNISRSTKIQYMIDNIDKLDFMERKDVAQMIWDDNITNKNLIEKKNDGLLIKTEILNDNLSTKIYNYIKNIL